MLSTLMHKEGADARQAAHVVDQRVLPSSRSTYDSKMRTMLQWALTRTDAKDLVSVAPTGSHTFDGKHELNLGNFLKMKVIADMFGWLSGNPELAKKRHVHSHLSEQDLAELSAAAAARIARAIDDDEDDNDIGVGFE